MITDAFWKRQFNSDPKAIGSTVKFADAIFTITGVLPPELRFPARADIYVPAWIRPAGTSRSAHNYRVVARLRDGVSVGEARAELLTIARRLEAEYPSSNAGKLLDVITLQEQIVAGSKQTLYTLLGAVPATNASFTTATPVE